MRLKLYRLFIYYRYSVPLGNYLDKWMLNRRMKITIKKKKKKNLIMTDNPSSCIVLLLTKENEPNNTSMKRDELKQTRMSTSSYRDNTVSQHYEHI